MFQDRAARLDLSFPLEFCVEDATWRGNCLNISASGLLGAFGAVPELWTTGQLRLHFGRETHELPARVARVQDNEAGLVFVFRDQADRDVVDAMLAFAERTTHLVGQPPF